MRKTVPLVLGIILFFASAITAQEHSLRPTIEAITRSITGRVGVAVMHLDSRDTLTVNGKDHYPMQSVYKFPLALAVLDQVDRGKLSLEQKIHLSKEEMIPNTWSPLAKKYPEGNVDIPLREVLRCMVSEGDNNACDMLFRLIGGPKKAAAYVYSIGVKDLAIVNTEAEMHKSWDIQFANWSKPMAMVRLLELSFGKDLLSPSSKDLLHTFMKETITGFIERVGQPPTMPVLPPPSITLAL
jgi:beta-lactamase class A